MQGRDEATTEALHARRGVLSGLADAGEQGSEDPGGGTEFGGTDIKAALSSR